jgi:large subunit ribosomal protein L24
MKFKVGDKVLITTGKDKGKKSVVVALLTKENKVLVKDINLYYKHTKPYMDKPGEKTRSERPLSVANIAILNDQDQPDRLAYRFTTDGQKERIFRKTGQLAKVEKLEKTVKADKKTKKATKKTLKKESAITDLNPKSSQTAIEAEKKAKKNIVNKISSIRRIRQTQDKG